MSANWSLAQAELARLAQRAGAPFSCVRQSSGRADGTGRDGAGGRSVAAGIAQPCPQQPSLKTPQSITKGAALPPARRLRWTRLPRIYGLTPTSASRFPGLRDLSPETARLTYLRDLATIKGKIEIKNARIAQADMIATGTGTLGVTTGTGADFILSCSIKNVHGSRFRYRFGVAQIQTQSCPIRVFRKF